MKNVLLIFWTIFCMSACPLQICICMAFKLFLLSLVMFSPSFALARPHRYRICIWGKTVLSVAYFDWRKSCNRNIFSSGAQGPIILIIFNVVCIKMFWCLRLSWTISIQGWVGPTRNKPEACRTRCTGVFPPHGK